MASFSTYPKKVNEVLAAVSAFKGSKEQKKLITGIKYFEGENETIARVRKQMWLDPKPLLDKNGNCEMDASGQPKKVGGGFVDNPYVANYKIGYGFFTDMVRQKVNTLLDEIPEVTNSDGIIEQSFLKRFGYALKVAGNKASAQGKAFMFIAYDSSIKVFDTENVIDYYDDETGELKAIIRFWHVNGRVEGSTAAKEILYIETYDQEGITIYWNGGRDKSLSIKKEKTPYKYVVKKDAVETRVEPKALERLPIVLFKNNEKMLSDLRPTIHAKIDTIDIMGSGFANNIDDFAEIYWLIYNGGGMDSQYLEDFVANINRTKKAILNGDGMSDGKMQIDTKQIAIPTEARSKIIEMLKEDLIQESGVIDTKNITASTLTQVAIKAAMTKLKERVSDFEWEAYTAATEIINLWQLYNDKYFKFDINFTENFLQNDTEILTNANSLYGRISLESYLALVKRATYIENVNEEIKRLNQQDNARFSLLEEGDNDELTQANGHVDSGNGKEVDANISTSI